MTAHELGHLLNEIRRDVVGLMNLGPAVAGLIRKVDQMALSLDAINVNVARLETAVAAVVAKLNTPGTDQPAVDALSLRVAAAADTLTAAAAPAP